MCTVGPLCITPLHALHTPSRHQAWLSVLDDGTPDRAAQLPDLRRLSTTPTDSPTASTAAAADSSTAVADSPAAGEAGGAAGPATADVAALDADLLADVVDLNYISIREDATLAALRGVEQRDLVGVWPEASLLNHSCTPNTSTVAVEVRFGVGGFRGQGHAWSLEGF